MTKGEAIQAYMDRFGGFPFMSAQGFPDEDIVMMIEKALETGKEIAFEFMDDCDY